QAVRLMIRPVERGPDDRVGEGAEWLACTRRILHDVVDAVDPVDMELCNFIALQIAQPCDEVAFHRTLGDRDRVHEARGVARALRFERVVRLALLPWFAAEADTGGGGANAALRGLARTKRLRPPGRHQHCRSEQCKSDDDRAMRFHRELPSLRDHAWP